MSKKRNQIDWIRLVLGETLSVIAMIGSLHTTIYSNLIPEQDLFHTFIVCFVCFLRDQIFTKMVVRPFQLPNAIERGFTRVMLMGELLIEWVPHILLRFKKPIADYYRKKDEEAKD